MKNAFRIITAKKNRQISYDLPAINLVNYKLSEISLQ